MVCAYLQRMHLLQLGFYRNDKLFGTRPLRDFLEKSVQPLLTRNRRETIPFHMDTRFHAFFEMATVVRSVQTRFQRIDVGSNQSLFPDFFGNLSDVLL